MRILIVCGAGASSTFLALRLAREARALEVDLDVRPLAEDALATETSADVVLVGPHLEASFERLGSRAEQLGARAILLPSSVFSSEGARRVLELVLDPESPAGASRTATERISNA